MAPDTNEQVLEAMVRETLLPLYLRATALYELFRRDERTSFVNIAITTNGASIGCVAVNLLPEDVPTKDLYEIALTAETLETAFAALSKIAARGETGALKTIVEYSRHRLVRLAARGILAEDDGK